jgi:lysine 2,3-aminomutase
VVIRNYEGYITTYAEPVDYDSTRIQHLENQVERRPEPGQGGVFELLEGHQFDIKPDGFDQVHRRGRAGEHRLSSDGHKWQPYGVGQQVELPKSEVEEDAEVGAETS